MTRRGLTRGAVGRAALRRVSGGIPRKARTGANTGAQVANPAEQDDDPRVSAEVARILEDLAGQIRRTGLAILGDRLAHVARQPNPLTPMPAQDSRDALLTAKDVAGLLNVDIRTLRRLRHLGDVPKPITVGRVLRWRRRDVDRWLEDGRG